MLIMLVESTMNEVDMVDSRIPHNWLIHVVTHFATMKDLIGISLILP